MKVMINGTWYDCERNDVIIECSSSELAMFAAGHMDKLTWSSAAVKQAKTDELNAKSKGFSIEDHEAWKGEEIQKMKTKRLTSLLMNRLSRTSTLSSI